MASISIKGTYSMDPETVRALEALARRWDVSKSEALRRAIRGAAASTADSAATPALKALDRLQRNSTLTSRTADDWAAEIRAERRSGRRNR